MLRSFGEGPLPAVCGICGIGNLMIRQGFAWMRAHGALADGAGHWAAIGSGTVTSRRGPQGVPDDRLQPATILLDPPQLSDLWRP
jgi:hypothetical protein